MVRFRAKPRRVSDSGHAIGIPMRYIYDKHIDIDKQYWVTLEEITNPEDLADED